MHWCAPKLSFPTKNTSLTVVRHCVPETIDVDSTKCLCTMPSGMAMFPWVPRDWNGVEHKTEMINNHKTRFSSRLILLIPTQTISSAASADVQEKVDEEPSQSQCIASRLWPTSNPAQFYLRISCKGKLRTSSCYTSEDFPSLPVQSLRGGWCGLNVDLATVRNEK